jgi:hypothetical protein
VDINEMLLKLSQGIIEFINGIGTWDWTTIVEWAKNFVLSGSAIVAIKYALPFFKNSNRPILAQLAVLGEKIVAAEQTYQDLKAENATLKQGLFAVLGYMETSAQVNLTSKTLTAEQKATFLSWLEVVKPLLHPEVVAEAQEAVADGVVTAEEVASIAEKVPRVAEVLLTPLNSIGGVAK